MNHTKTQQPVFEPCCLATTIGSLPHTDVARGTDLIFHHTPEIPSWAQFPKRDRYENMMMQFTEGMPALVDDGERASFDTSLDDFPEQLTAFYERYLAANRGWRRQRAGSFPPFVAVWRPVFPNLRPVCPNRSVREKRSCSKGRLPDRSTLGTNLVDQGGRCSYYDDQLRDVVVKTVVLKTLWQIGRFSEYDLPVMIFLDEPSLLGFGKQTYITISREDVTRDINEVTAAVHGRGGLAGVHCEENTDWSLLMETDLDILDFDAYDHLQGITLYPAELKKFFDRGRLSGLGNRADARPGSRGV